MYQRVVSLLLMPCLLLTQSVGLCHWHGDEQPAEHDAHPHFHTSSEPTGHGHSHRQHHHHGHGGHHHHHEDDLPAEAAKVVTPQPDPLSDHDADAIYLTATDPFVAQRSSVDVDGANSLWCAAALASSLGALEGDAPAGVPHQCDLHPPDPTCPLYVRHLTLLL